MRREKRIWYSLILVLVSFIVFVFGTSVSAQTLRLGETDPWQNGKYIGSYVKIFYGSSSPAGKLPQVITISAKTVVVTANSLNVRSGPGTNYKVVAGLNKGQSLRYIKESGGWYNVGLPNGSTGWVLSSYAILKNASQSSGTPQQPKPQDPIPQPKPETPVVEPGQAVSKQAVVTGSVVNIRSGPGTDYSVITKVSSGALLQVTRESTEWLKVITNDGKQGWAAAYLLSIKTNPPSRDERPDTPTNPEEPKDPPGDADGGSDSPAEALKLTEVTAETGEGYERIVIKADSPIIYTASRLANPERLVFDLANTAKAAAPDALGALNTWVSGVRVAQFSLEPLVTRVVIDLYKSASYKAYLSEDKKSLTVEFKDPTVRDKKVVIDAGHGGYDPGAVGVTGLQEKEVNLSIANKVAELLREQQVEVVMTRESDNFISLTDRAKAANDLQADIFVSIHANSSEYASTNGTSTYYYAPSSDPGLYAQSEQRKGLAAKVQNQLGTKLGIRNIGIKQANFSVLRNTWMPSILVETAFLSNEKEEALLKQEEFRDKAATAIVEGIIEYFTEV